MNSRDEILTRIRKAQPASRPLPEIPTFDQGSSTSIETFKAALLRMGGRFVDAASDGNLDAQVRGALSGRQGHLFGGAGSQGESPDRARSGPAGAR